MNISGIKLQPRLFRHPICKSITCSVQSFGILKSADFLGYSVSCNGLVEGALSNYGLVH